MSLYKYSILKFLLIKNMNILYKNIYYFILMSQFYIYIKTLYIY